MLTANKYNGNLGGQAGADAKCHAEYPGFKFARSGTILRNIPGIVVNNAAQFAWVGSSVAKNHLSYDCAGWTSTGIGWGATVDINTNTMYETSGPGNNDCHDVNPLLCCNL